MGGRLGLIRVVLGSVVLLVASSAVGLQSEPTEDAERATRLVTDAVLRVMLERLRATDAPERSDYEITARALSIVCDYFPRDEELLRLQRDAWRAGGFLEEESVALRKIIKLDASDDVALLQIVSRGIRRLQDADSRLAAYDRFLAEASFSRFPALRSRLAFDAALLARESGDEDRYRDYLLMASQTDVTNKEAAALFATEYLDFTDDPLARVEILANVILADPLGAGAYQNFIHEVMKHGAFAAARRFMQLQSNLLLGSGSSLSPDQLFDYHLCLWAMDGAEACIDPLTQMEIGQREGIERFRESQIERGLDPGPEREVTLPNALERMRLAVAVARDETDEALDALRRLNLNFTNGVESLEERIAENNEIITNYKDPLLWPRGYSQALANQDIADAKSENERFRAEIPRIKLFNALELTAMRVLSGLELEKALPDIEWLKTQVETGDVSEDAIARFEGALAAHNADLDVARSLLEPLAAQGDVIAKYALAIAFEKANDRGEWLRRLATLYLEHPNTGLGAVARSRIEKERGSEVPRTPTARTIDEYAEDFAPWLEELTSDANAFMTLNVAHPATVITPLDRSELRLTLRNISRTPLALGISRPIHSRILLAPAVLVDGQDIRRSGRRFNKAASKFLTPEVLSLDRRLRLEPGEELSATVWTGKGGVGIVSDRAVLSGVTTRWRAVQGFRAQNSDVDWLDAEALRFSVGPFCISAMSNRQERRGFGRPDDTPQVIELLEAAEGDQVYAAIMMFQGWIQQLSFDQSTDPDEQDRQYKVLAETLSNQIPGYDDAQRAWVVVQLAPIGFFPSYGEGMLAALREGGGVLTLMAQALDSRNAPDESLYQMCADSGNEHLARIGELIEASLEGVEMTAPVEESAAPEEESAAGP